MIVNGLPGFARGDVLTAEELNALAAAHRRTQARYLPQAYGGSVQGNIGDVLMRTTVAEIDARITGQAGGAYSWHQVIETAGGNWTDGVLTGSTSVDPAYEYNGNTAVAIGTRVRMRRATTTGQWVYQLAQCTSTAMTPTIPPSFVLIAASDPHPTDPRIIAGASGTGVPVGGLRHASPFGGP